LKPYRRLRVTQRQANSAQNTMKSTTLYLLFDRKELCVYADSGRFKEIVSIVSYANVNPPGKAGFDQIAGS
jgi:hypothetical protein